MKTDSAQSPVRTWIRQAWPGSAGPLVSTAAQMREVDRRTIEEFGVDGDILMDAAGRAVADEACAMLAESPGLTVVLAGPGNNGGDGYVVARVLANRGFPVQLWCVSDPAKARGEARRHYDRAVAAAVPVVDMSGSPSLAACKALACGRLVVDAMLGTGVSSPLRGAIADWVHRVNESDAAVLAVDIPSGVCADTGQILGVATRCARTVTFGLAKVGLCQHPGAGRAGQVVVADIGLSPRAIAAVGPNARWMDRRAAADALRSDTPDAAAHKGSRGRVAVFAGGPGKTGAALLAGSAALHAGAGLVVVATDAASQARVDGRIPELMTESVRAEPHDRVELAPVAGWLEAATNLGGIIAVGPGFGTHESTRRLVLELIRRGCRLVIDADALAAFAGEPELLQAPAELSVQGPRRVVLTPHPGEAARLLGVSIAEVQADRLSAARQLAERSAAFVVLKGAGTVVASADGRVEIILAGNPGMATAGSGDVLTGVIAARLVTREFTLATIASACFLHAAAGDFAASSRPDCPLVASELIGHLPRAWRHILAD